MYDGSGKRLGCDGQPWLWGNLGHLHGGLVVGLCTGRIKTGALCCSEHLAKYNQLLRIEEELGDTSCFAGKTSKFHWISKWKMENTSKQ